MKYSLQYNRLSKYKDTIDELIIDYNKKSLNLIEFAAARPKNQRLVVNITMLEEPEDNLDIFAQAAAAHPNFAITMKIGQLSPYDLIHKKINFFYQYYPSAIDEVVAMILDGVSDVYITNELGFNMPKLSALCYRQEVNIRVLPNVAQSTAWWNKKNDTLTQFYVRPEDIPLYEDYVDYMEIFGSIQDQDYCYEIYKEQKWLGRLDQIIIGYEGKAYNRELSNMFGLQRLTCQKKCNLTSCSICHQFQSLSTKLFEADKTLKYPEMPLTREEYEEKLKDLVKEKDNERNKYKIDKENLSYESELPLKDNE